MEMMKLAVAAICAVSVLAGCKDVGVTATAEAVRSPTTYAVVVGMDSSAFAGACPGATYDAARMSRLLTQYATNVVYLHDADATKDRVVAAIADAVGKAELFVFYYSGHGGSQRFSTTGSEEADGQDEFYCLYDRYLIDNEMWSLISKARGRVLIINDCCHSQTIYRGITLRNCLRLSATHAETGPINMQCWSGCPDDTYSYGSSSGGKFTNTLLRKFSADQTYDVLWNEIENDSDLKRYERVQRTVMGCGFTGKRVFQ